MSMLASNKEIKNLMSSRMQFHLKPHLLSLGFSPIGDKRAAIFHAKWVRDRNTEIDAIMFQWDNYFRPSFVINFRSFDNQDDLIKCRSDPNSIQPWDFGCRAYMEPNPSGWFRVRFGDRVLGLNRAVEAVMQSAKARLTEISDFLLGKPPSKFMQDSVLWLDERVKTSPPPWHSGPVGSQYHLPPRRVGSGDRLSLWS